MVCSAANSYRQRTFAGGNLGGDSGGKLLPGTAHGNVELCERRTRPERQRRGSWLIRLVRARQMGPWVYLVVVAAQKLRAQLRGRMDVPPRQRQLITQKQSAFLLRYLVCSGRAKVYMLCVYEVEGNREA